MVCLGVSLSIAFFASIPAGFPVLAYASLLVIAACIPADLLKAFAARLVLHRVTCRTTG